VVSPFRRIEVDARALDKAIERMEKFEPKMKRRLSSDIKKPMKQALPELTGAVPSAPPIGRTTPLQSGVARNWGPVKGLLRTYPKAKPGRAIGLIGIDGVSGEMSKYLMITETAGSRTPGGKEPRGRALINSLQQRYPLVGSGGRFVWRQWLKTRPELRSDVIAILDRYVKQFNRRGRI